MLKWKFSFLSKFYFRANKSSDVTYLLKPDISTYYCATYMIRQFQAYKDK